MNLFRVTNYVCRLLPAALGSTAVVLFWLSGVAIAAELGPGAQPPTAPDPNAPGAYQAGIEGDASIGAPGFVPASAASPTAPGGDFAAPLGGTPYGPGGMIPGANNPNTPDQQLQMHMQELQSQQERLARDYQATMKAIKQSLPPAVQLDMDRQSLQKQLAEAKAQIADLSARRDSVAATPLPENAVLRAFPLKYVKPEDIGQALHNITGGGGPRIAVDERTNALLIAGNEKQMSVAEQLVQTLDQPGKSDVKSSETLQIRIVWLLDGVNGRAPAVRIDTGSGESDSFVSPAVVGALNQLGFSNPSVVCQQLSTLTVGASDRSGDFHFQVPTLIAGSPWQFEGQGKITSTPDNRYSMQFNLDVVQPNNSERCQIGGSIVTPLDHYTVLGTTNFVGSEVKDQSEGPLSEHLSAFVVYIDRAKEFPNEVSTGKDKPRHGR